MYLKYKKLIKIGKSFEVAGFTWQPRKKRFVGCNGKAAFDPAAIIATSYNWWVFVRPIKNKIVFNRYKYSMTTGQHQYAVSKLMETLGFDIYIKADLGAQSLSEHPDIQQIYFNYCLAILRNNDTKHYTELFNKFNKLDIKLSWLIKRQIQKKAAQFETDRKKLNQEKRTAYKSKQKARVIAEKLAVDSGKVVTIY